MAIQAFVIEREVKIKERYFGFPTIPNKNGFTSLSKAIRIDGYEKSIDPVRFRFRMPSILLR